MIQDVLSTYQIILASGSPRRQKLLKELGVDFKVVLRPVPEDHPSGMRMEEIALFLSERKAAAFEKEFFRENTMLITADTIVCLGDEVLGKPDGREDAIETLLKLSGKKHRVITGVSIKTLKKNVKFSVSTDVYFKELGKEELIYYVDHYEPYDKAGAYGIQEWIGYVGIEKIEGSFYNVMGLPVLKLYEELLKF
ncbi:MAG: septum formation protein Maf [Bacteroidetes bacterium]|nr:septum formation protein Maf [Bacteroidota bacterium]